MSMFAFALAAGQDVAQRGRVALSSFLQPSGSAPLVSRDGLVNDGGGVVTVVAGTMKVRVSAFRGFVQGRASGQGVYPVASLSDVDVTLPNGGASGKTYRIVGRVQDSSMDSSGVQLADLTYIDPSSPPATSYIPIWDVNVRAGLSAAGGGLLATDLVQDVRRYCAAAGGITPVTSAADRDSITIDGASVYRTDIKKIQTRRGSLWYTMPFFQGGTVLINPNSNNAQTNKTVTFPTPFQSTPYVQLTIGTGINSDNENQVWSDPNTWTPSQFVVSLRRGNTTATQVAWAAFEA